MDSTDLTRAGLGLAGGLFAWGVKEVNDRWKKRADEERIAQAKALDALRDELRTLRESCNDSNEARRKTLHDHAERISALAVKISYLEASVGHLEKKP